MLVQLHDVTGLKLVNVVVVNLVDVMVVTARGTSAGTAAASLTTKSANTNRESENILKEWLIQSLDT